MFLRGFDVDKTGKLNGEPMLLNGTFRLREIHPLKKGVAFRVSATIRHLVRTETDHLEGSPPVLSDRNNRPGISPMPLAKLTTAILLVLGTSLSLSPARSMSEQGSKPSRDDQTESDKGAEIQPGHLLVFRVAASQKHDAEAIRRPRPPRA